MCEGEGEETDYGCCKGASPTQNWPTIVPEGLDSLESA